MINQPFAQYYWYDSYPVGDIYHDAYKWVDPIKEKALELALRHKSMYDKLEDVVKAAQEYEKFLRN